MGDKLKPVILDARTKHTATVIFLHGLGDSGHGWSFLGDELSTMLPHVKWVMPNAPMRTISKKGGFRMTAWFDIISSDRTNIKEQDEKGIMDTVGIIYTLLKQEMDNGIPANRIIIGGFSQGGIMSLLTGLTLEHKLAGIIGCSCWLMMTNELESLACEVNKQTPILLCHGDQDPIVKFELGEDTAKKLKNHGYNVTFIGYPGLSHSACPEEVEDIAQFIKDKLPQS